MQKFCSVAPARNGSPDPPGDKVKNKQGGSVPKSPTLETTQMPIGNRTDKHTVVQPPEGILRISEQDKSTDIGNNTSEPPPDGLLMERSETSKNTYCRALFTESSGKPYTK